MDDCWIPLAALSYAEFKFVPDVPVPMPAQIQKHVQQVGTITGNWDTIIVDDPIHDDQVDAMAMSIKAIKPKPTLTIADMFTLKPSLASLNKAITNTSLSAEQFAQAMKQTKQAMEQMITASFGVPPEFLLDPPFSVEEGSSWSQGYNLKDAAAAKEKLMTWLDENDAKSFVQANPIPKGPPKSLFVDPSQHELSIHEVHHAMQVVAEMHMKADGSVELFEKKDPVFGESLDALQQRVLYQRRLRERTNLLAALETTERLVANYRTSLERLDRQIDDYEITHDLQAPADPDQPTRLITLTDGD